MGIEISAMIKDYTSEVSEAIEKEVDSTAKETLKEVKATAPRDRPKYYKGFALKTDKSGGQVVKVIYNKTHPGLVHLLEIGHAKVGGDRVDERPHLRPAYDKYAPRLEKNIERIIKNGG